MPEQNHTNISRKLMPRLPSVCAGGLDGSRCSAQAGVSVMLAAVQAAARHQQRREWLLQQSRAGRVCAP